MICCAASGNISNSATVIDFRHDTCIFHINIRYMQTILTLNRYQPTLVMNHAYKTITQVGYNKGSKLEKCTTYFLHIYNPCL